MTEITVFNKRENKEESFTPEQALDWLEEIGLFAAYEMYSGADVTKLMNHAKGVKP
jgi:hypothetical protein